MSDSSSEVHGDVRPERIRQGSLAFLPLLLDKEEAQDYVPFPLFPEPWVFRNKVPAGYCLSWTDGEENETQQSRGELAFMVWSAYGPQKGFCAVRTFRTATNGQTPGLLTAIHSHTADLQPLPHPFLYGGEVTAHGMSPLQFRSWSPLPFVTATLPITFLTVIGGRVHRYGLEIRGNIRLAACDVIGESFHSLPLPNWSPLFGMQVYRARIAMQATVEIDLKSPNCGKPRCFVAPAAAS